MIDLHSKMRESVLIFLWNQWDSLGAPARGDGKAAPFAIDPEALLLASLRFAETDARMADIVADWVPGNGAFLNLQRLRNLQSATHLATPESLATLADLMESAGFRSWKSLRGSSTKISAATVIRASGLKSRKPDTSRPEAFLLKMRMLYGLGARAEIITWLLTHPSGHAAKIARETGWFSKSVQAILNDLETCGALISHWEGRKKIVTPAPRNGDLFPAIPVGLRWFAQAPFYIGVFQVILTLEGMAKRMDASDAVQSILIRQDLVATNAAFRQAGVLGLFETITPLSGSDAMRAFGDGCETLLGKIEDRDLP